MSKVANRITDRPYGEMDNRQNTQGRTRGFGLSLGSGGFPDSKSGVRLCPIRRELFGDRHALLNQFIKFSFKICRQLAQGSSITH